MAGDFLSIADYAKWAGERLTDLERDFIDAFVRDTDWLAKLPVRDIDGLQAAVRIWHEYPQVGYRLINEPFPKLALGSWSLQTTDLIEIGGYIPVDIALRELPTADLDPLAENLQRVVQGMRWQVADLVFNGAKANNVRVFNGVVEWFKGPDGATQTVNANNLDLSPDATNLDANIHTFLDYLDEAIFKCEGHEADLIMVSPKTLLRIRSIAHRIPQLFPAGQNKLGLQVESYRGAAIVQAGFQPNSQTPIISDGTPTQGTTIYVMKLGLAGVRLIQRGGPRVEDIGRGSGQDAVNYYYMVRWPVAVQFSGPRPMARVTNVIVV